MEGRTASEGPSRPSGLSLAFLAPFVVASWTYSVLVALPGANALGAAIVSSVVSLLVGCALCVREDAGALFGVAAGLWAVAATFFAMPWLVRDYSAATGAWIAASDLSFCASVSTDRMAKDLGLGRAGQIAAAAVSAHGVLLAVVFVIGGPWVPLAYTALVAAHAYGIRKRIEALAPR
jgi:hypothetical protein